MLVGIFSADLSWKFHFWWIQNDIEPNCLFIKTDSPILSRNLVTASKEGNKCTVRTHCMLGPVHDGLESTTAMNLECYFVNSINIENAKEVCISVNLNE